MIYNILDDNGNVTNTILATESFVEANYPGHYALVGPEPAPPPLPRIVTRLAVVNRFTDAEYIAILTAAKTDVAVQAWKERLDLATQIDLDNERTRAGAALLVSKSLLTQARADALLDDPVQDAERP